MKRNKKLVTALLMAAALQTSLQAIVPSQACAPEFPYAVFYNVNHPDLPLESFARGNLGILQRSYAKSYLIVAYRYLERKPLTDTETASIMRLWKNRLKELNGEGTYFWNQADNFLALREKVLGPGDKTSKKDNAPAFYSNENLTGASLAFATQNLSDILKRTAAGGKAGTSSEAKQWLKNQEIVFKTAAGESAGNLVAPPATASSYAKDDFLYQKAALAFYQKKYSEAEKLFAALIADDGKGSAENKYGKLALYMMARCQYQAVQEGQVEEAEAIEKIEALLKKVEKNRFEERQEMLDLLQPLVYDKDGLKRRDIVKATAQSITAADAENFGTKVGDLTYSLDEMSDDGESQSEPEPYNEKETDEERARKEKLRLEKAYKQKRELAELTELSDWLETIQQRLDAYSYDSVTEKAFKKTVETQKSAYALSKFKDKKTLPWLVAAVLTGNLDKSEVLEAAKQVSKESPAYKTISFYLVDHYIKTAQKEKALERLATVSGNNLESTENLFKAQRIALADDIKDYLKAAAMKPAETNTYTTYVSPDWKKRLNSKGESNKESASIDERVAEILNQDLPLKYWVDFMKGTNDRGLKAILARTIFVRAQILNNQSARAEALNQLAVSDAKLYNSLKTVDDSKAGRYNFAKICLQNFGLRPYLKGGTERHGLAYGEFDYYNDNYWTSEKDSQDEETEDYKADNLQEQMLKSYLAKLPPLSQEDKQQAAKEAKIIKANPAAVFLGNAVFARLKENPADASLPETLYRLVKQAKWSQGGALATEYSKKAHSALHKQFPQNSWTKKAPYYY